MKKVHYLETPRAKRVGCGFEMRKATMEGTTEKRAVTCARCRRFCKIGGKK